MAIREVCRQVCPFFEQQTRKAITASTRKMIQPAALEVKRETPLSSLAYFDANLKNHKPSLIHGAKYHMDGHLPRATNAANRRIALEKPVQVAIHADMMKVKIPATSMGAVDRESSGGGIRGKVNSFSRASRKRMIETMASVRNTGAMLFLTMTFDDSVLLDLNENLNPMFEAFRRRFERTYPTWAALWRKEWQDRKSGDFIGTFVPHYHFIIMTGVHYEKNEIDVLSQSFAAWGKQAWHEITSSADENHLIYGFDVSPIKSRKHAYYYVSKYIAKQESNGEFEGRHWGRIGKLDCTVSESFSLDIEEYVIFRRLVKKWLKTRHLTMPENPSPEQKANWLKRHVSAKGFASFFARQSKNKGCTVFGLGDTDIEGNSRSIFAGYWQFITEAQRQVAERKERERGYGN